MADLIQNKKAFFNYEIMDKFDAGVELFGFEVKSLRAKLGSLEGSHITVRGDEAFLIGASIPAFQPKNSPADYEPTRNRRLLLTKQEIEKLNTVETRSGSGGGGNLTIVPISVYNSGRFIKVKIAIARGKKKFDKRETIKRRDTERDIGREFKDR